MKPMIPQGQYHESKFRYDVQWLRFHGIWTQDEGDFKIEFISLNIMMA